MCGEHTRELLLELGYSDAEIDGFVADRRRPRRPVERP